MYTHIFLVRHTALTQHTDILHAQVHTDRHTHMLIRLELELQASCGLSGLAIPTRLYSVLHFN